MLRIIRSAAVCFMALGYTACSADSIVTVQSPETILFDPSLGIDLSAMTRSSTGLYTRDLIVGTGAEAINGKRLVVRYTGYLNNGIYFDTTGPGESFSFVLGAGEVIKGWDEGLVGMKVGGRRSLVIPPALAYNNVAVGEIPAGSVVIFGIELVAVQ